MSASDQVSWFFLITLTGGGIYYVYLLTKRIFARNWEAAALYMFLTAGCIHGVIYDVTKLFLTR